MNTASAVATRVRIATAASAIVAAATLAPAAVAYAVPAAPSPAATLGSTLDGDTVATCDPDVSVCTAVTFAVPGGSSSSSIFQSPLFWFGPANPNFQPLFGIAFPSFGISFEACFLGASIHLSPYGTGFIGLGLGC
jgi:hypothetical protein